jgi:cytochrome c-type biogenesis protein CcmF
VVWIVATSVQHLVERLRGRSGRRQLVRAREARCPAAGGVCGWRIWVIAVTIVGITLVKGFEQNIDLKMAPGQTATAGRIHLPLRRCVCARPVPNYDAAPGRIEMTRDGRTVAMM